MTAGSSSPGSPENPRQFPNKGHFNFQAYNIKQTTLYRQGIQTSPDLQYEEYYNTQYILYERLFGRTLKKWVYFLRCSSKFKLFLCGRKNRTSLLISIILLPVFLPPLHPFLPAICRLSSNADDPPTVQRETKRLFVPFLHFSEKVQVHRKYAVYGMHNLYFICPICKLF